jgi:phosphinothricin acetyltransferase
VGVRAATAADVPRLTEIYNHYIVHTPATFDIEPMTIAERAEWFSHYATTGPHRVLVAEADGAVLGSAWSSPFRPKRAYDTTVETSVYCAPEAVGRGLGSALYDAIFGELARVPGLHRAMAAITLPNDASVALHERFGFRRTGLLEAIGWKLGQYWDVALFEKPLD